MIDENRFAIRGGTKFFPDSEPQEYDTMNEYFQRNAKAQNQMANMNQRVQVYQPGGVFTQNIHRPQSSSHSKQQENKIVRSPARVEGAKVEDRLLLFEQRRIEKLEKTRNQIYSEIVKPSSAKKSNGQVFERLYGEKKSIQSPQFPRGFNSESSTVSLNKLIKPMPQYQQKKKSENLQKPVPNLEKLVFNSYISGASSGKVSLANVARSPLRTLTRDFSNQPRGILDQCMEAYFRKKQEQESN